MFPIRPFAQRTDPGSGIRQGRRAICKAVVLRRDRIEIGSELGSVHHLIGLVDLLKPIITFEIDGWRSDMTFPRGDEYNAVRAAATIYGGGRGVLQDLDRLDVLRIDRVEIARAGKAVHDKERLVAGIDGIRAADADTDVAARRRIGLGHLDAARSAL